MSVSSPTTLCGRPTLEKLAKDAFGSSVKIGQITEIGQGKGTFSDVYRAHVEIGPSAASRSTTPETVVAKLPIDSANRDAAAASGAYRREDVAYQFLLPGSPIQAPRCYARMADGPTAAFLLEDLTNLRFVDQLDGLEADDAISVAGQLTRFHRFWSNQLSKGNDPADLYNIRSATVSRLAPDQLQTGLAVLRNEWAEIGSETIDAFASLVANRERLVDLFVAASEPASGATTLCHGDPRADNLCFDDSGAAVLFDWQQIAIQFGEADLAWLAATSLTPEVRRECDNELVSAAQADLDRFRLGLTLPGLAALMLAQRVADHPRTRKFIVTSLRRIGTALVDYEVARI